jgi:folate-binding protein YgfZ
MSERVSIELKNRRIIRASGKDTYTFLQGMISNDISKVSNNQSIYSTFLTPQGKFLNDFFVIKHKDHLLLDCEKGREDSLVERLENYKLGSDIVFQKEPGYQVFALITNDFSVFNLEDKILGSTVSSESTITMLDPRHKKLGLRSIILKEEGKSFFKKEGFSNVTFDEYEKLRIPLGIPDGSRDIEVGKGLLMESGVSELNGIDWDKGCYLGQELTARTKFRGQLKRRLIPVKSEGPCPKHGSEIHLQEKLIGTVRSGIDNYAIALLEIDHVKKQESSKEKLTAQGIPLIPIPPDWIKI